MCLYELKAFLVVRTSVDFLSESKLYCTDDLSVLFIVNCSSVPSACMAKNLTVKLSRPINHHIATFYTFLPEPHLNLAASDLDP
jgi:hypothetical protein